jgi:hypothetical protein
MANTVIQLKWSDATSTPTTLNVGEAAYSNTSHKFFIGDTAGNVLTIGGKYFTDQQGQIFTKTNVAFDTANSAASYANAAFASSNNNAGAAVAGLYANGAFLTANSAASYANSAYTRANNSVNANTGGTITADLVITGNLTVQGNTTYVDTRTITTGDSLIHLANNNTVGDTVDIGFYGSYNSSGLKYTGLVRQAGADYFLFKGLTSDPTSNVLAAGSLTAANTGTLTANLTAYAVSINGVDVETNQARIFTQANSAYYTANSAGSYANAAFSTANTDVTNISITAADYGKADSVAAFRVEANGRIVSANSTAIAIAASAITSGTLGVPRGGTGAGTFTTNGVLLGQGTSAFSTASSSTEGHVLTINASGVPTFSYLQGGTF